MIRTYGGKQYDFPDNATDDQINSFYNSLSGSQNQASANKSPAEKNMFFDFGSTDKKNLSETFGIPNPEYIRGMNAPKNIAAGMYKGAQGVASNMRGMDEPWWSPTGKMADMANKNPSAFEPLNKAFMESDPNKMLGISRPDQQSPFLQGIGQMSLGALMPEVEVGTGAAYLGQQIPKLEQFARMLASKVPGQFAYGASQNKEHPIIGGLENSIIPVAEGIGTFAPEITQFGKQVGQQGINLAKQGFQAGKQALQPVANAGIKVLDQFKPEKLTNEYLQSLGSGTSQDNARALATNINKSYREQNAIQKADREDVIKKIGNNDIFKRPESEIVEGNMPRVASVFNGGDPRMTPDQQSLLKGAITQYRKTGNTDAFIESGHDIFNPPKELSPKDTRLVEDMLGTEPFKDSQFFADKSFHDNFINGKDTDLSEVVDKFSKRKSFSNADDVQKQLNVEIARLSKLQKQGKLDNAGRMELRQYAKAKDNIDADMDAILSRNPALKAKYYATKKYWMENILPYKTDPTVARIAHAKPKKVGDVIKGITPSELNSIFAHPGEDIETISSHMGEPGRKSILANALHNKDLENLDEVIGTLKNTEGFQNYINPEDEAIAKEFAKRTKYSKIAKASATGAAGLHNPMLGAAVGAKLYGGDIVDALKAMLKHKGGN